MGRDRRSAAARLVAAGLGLALLAAWPVTVLAHPLGNFTINHYAGVRIEVGRILLDVVIDVAEVPTFQARQEFDLDGDGSVSDEETEEGRVGACRALAESLELSADGRRLELPLRAAGLSFPPGVGGLSTMRQVCEFDVPLSEAIGPEAAVRIEFSDRSFPERLGWREIVATGSGVSLRAVDGDLRDTGLSDRLRRYPEDLLASPPTDEGIVVDATAGGPSLPDVVVSDAQLVPGVAPTGPTPPPSSSQPPGAGEPVTIPGGIAGGEVPAIFRQADLTPLVILLSFATAAALGAGHALTPGHGKTLMAAYLIGTRGSARHALGLGIAVSVSHTAGILALAAVVVLAADVLAPDIVVRWAPVVAAVSIVAIGAWMLLGEVRRRRAARHGLERDHGHQHDHDHGHDHSHGHDHDHSHAPLPGSTITWRSLFLLGLAGGLIPSASALLILLGSIAAGRPAFGLALVIAFGIGMAAVMGGIGLLLVVARGRFDRLEAGAGIARVREAVPLAAAVVVLAFGVVLTAQALSAIPIA